MILQVRVHPASRPQRIIKISEDSFEAYLKSPAENDKANTGTGKQSRPACTIQI